MSIDAVVRQVGETLGRGHALFADTPASGAAAARAAGAALSAGADQLRGGLRQVTTLSGTFPAIYARLAADAGTALDAAADTDRHLGVAVHHAGHADRAGHARSGALIDRAAADTTTLRPLAGSAAGQRALLTALRTRLAQQRALIAACRRRDARLAAMLRALTYRSPCAGGGIPRYGPSFGSGGSPIGISPRGLGPSRATPTTAVAAARVGPGRPVGVPLGALRTDSSPREVAAAIIGEARRRGYSPYQATAILADALQESGLRPRAVSPNGLWESIFQQDASYPGRGDPNLAIAEFFNRLAHHGGPHSPDIWKSIFWLQQRPGEPSAEAAYANGRKGYLSEIMSQHARAVAMFRGITGLAVAL